MRILLAASVCAVAAAVNAADTTAPVGVWQTYDDDTHAAKAWVEIEAHDGGLSGRIIKLFREPGEDPNPRCRKCHGERHEQPVLGMIILWGMRRDDDAWSGGEILDPEDGKTYRCTLRSGTDGELEVRGFLGISLLGRTQLWKRVAQ
jgi:uncharacterized protein (DUF2147 family)